MRRRDHRMFRYAAAVLLVCAIGAGAHVARAYINQVDGTVVPQTTRMQACLDRAGTGELAPRAVDAVADARTLPEAYRPVEDPVGSGRYPVSFAMIGEGAGYTNSFGWYWVDEDPSNPANLHTVFTCRTGPICSCPCDPATMRSDDGSTASWRRTLDFSTIAGFTPGRAIGFWIRSPERIDGSGNDPDNCGGRTDTTNRIYFTSKALNDDGDYVHFLVYRSATRVNTYYFGFEDLWRGGDNDFEDVLVRATGLVPLCDPQPETCNDRDDDCDLAIDEGLTRACSTSCGSGVEACTAGAWGMCSAPTAAPEVCDGVDNDCNGVIDGLTRACSSVCGAGTERCEMGAWLGCTAPLPGTEFCNDLDDDCDGTIDEGLTRTCSTSCGTGNEHCEAGAWVGCDAPMPGTEVCNNLDDDCNGVIDDGNPGGGAACVPTDDGGYMVVDEGMPPGDICIPGRVQCSAGVLRCGGASSATREICNCMDDDCDGEIDESSGDSICPGGACVGCTCVSPCEPGEFACPPGRECDRSYADPSRDLIGYCVPGMCAGVECTDEEVCNPATGMCDNLCTDVMCRDGYACVRGSCVEDNCYGRGCDPGRVCRMGSCIDDPCRDVSCGDGEFCRGGSCVAACVTGCEATQNCVDGTCVDDACGGRCSDGEYCSGGTCVDNACDPPCGRGRVCRASACVDDPCSGIRCPSGLVCDDGQCTSEMPIVPEDPRFGLASGGGGCTCTVPGSTSAGDASGGAAALALVALLGLALGRRRRALRDLLGAGLAIGVAVTASGCEVDPFCFENCGDEPPVVMDAGVDARPPDGCVSTGIEVCDGTDNDCNGIVDDGFDLAADPANCGECGRECIVPQAFAGCELGECVVRMCEIGWHDLDDNPANGCEYECPPSGDELCDDLDNDCDGRTDEGIDRMTRLDHCGGCGNLCSFPNATASCTGGVCSMGPCNAGYVDFDGMPDNGCEYRCTPTGVETCNSVDDDCDRMVDEGFDLMTSTMHCGACGRACTFPHATGACVMGTCGLGTCTIGWVDLDGDPATGCEYGCTTTGTESCNGMDDDCDGIVDDGVTPSGAIPSCAETRGVCAGRTPTCRGAAGWACDLPATYQTTETICDTLDNDCDGTADEGCLRPAPGGDVRLDTGDTATQFNSVQPFVSGDGAMRVYVTWMDRRLGASRIFFNRSTDGGLSWLAGAGRVDSGSGAAIGPRIAVSETTGSTLSVVWSDFRGGTSYREIYERRSVDSLATFSTVDRRLNPLQNTDSFNVDVAVSGTNFYAVYESFSSPRSRHIYLVRSADSGGTWTGPVQVDAGTGTSFVAATPRVAAVGPIVYVTWRDNRNGALDVFVKRSTDRGSTFPGLDVRMDVGTMPGASTSFSPDIAAEGTNVYVTWVDDRSGGSFDVWMNYSRDAGATWRTADAVRLDADPLGHDSIEPRVVAPAAGRAVVSWIDYRYGFPDVLATHTADAGATWSAPARLDTGTANGTSGSYDMALGARGSLVVAAWSDDRAGFLDIHANFSLDGGATWQPSDYRLDTSSVGTSDSERPSVFVGTSAAHVVWVDHRRGAGCPDTTGGTSCSNGDIYYRRIQ